MNLLVIRNLIKKRKQSAGFSLLIRSFHLQRGANLAIVGPSGCGKSTTLDLLGMVLKPDQCDEFSLNFTKENLNIAKLWQAEDLDRMARLRREHLGYVLQTGELLPYLSVAENVELTYAMGRGKGHGLSVSELLRLLEIEHLAKALPKTLSIGERQRAAIARALASSPELLLADEPTAALDPNLSRKVLRLFLDLARRLQTAIVMVSHDVNLVDEFHFQKLAINVERSSLGTTSVLDDGVSLEESKDWQINTSTNNHKKLPSATNLLLPNKGAKLPQGVGL